MTTPGPHTTDLEDAGLDGTVTPGETPDGPQAAPPGANVARPAVVVERGSVGAVTAFWSDDADGPLRATLTFRVGEADERLRTRGRCHLLRALVLDAIATESDGDSGDVAISTSITTLRTRFTVSGSDDAVGRTLTGIARALSAPRIDRAEQLIPRVVAEWNAPERWDTELMSLRFGSRGYGLPALPLLGLTDLDPTAFDDWIRTWFTADNAVVHANRPLPASLSLAPLADGVRKPLPEPHPLDRDLPGIARGSDDRISLSVLGRYDATSSLLFGLTIDRIHRRCREISPRMSRPTTVTRRTGTGLSTTGISIVAPNDVLPDVRDAVSSELFNLAMNGPTTDELDAARVTLRRSGPAFRRAGRPGHAGSAGAEQQAMDHLFGEDQDIHAALHATRDDLAKVIRDGIARAIWVLPAGVPVADRRLLPVRALAAPVTDGQVHQRAAHAGAGPAERLIVSPEGVSCTDAHGVVTTVRFVDLVTLEAHANGQRTLWSVDGTRLSIDPTQWTDGEQIPPAIDGRVEPWVQLHEPTPAGPADPGT